MKGLTFKQFLESTLSKKPYISYNKDEYGYEVYDRNGKRIDSFYHEPRDVSDKKDAYAKALVLKKKLDQ